MSPVDRRRLQRRVVVAGAACAALFIARGLVPPSAVAQGEASEECAGIGRDLVVESGERRDCDVSVVSGDVRVEEQGLVAGDVGVFSGDLFVAGSVEGDVAVAWGDGAISGEVDGDVFVSGDLELLDGARIGGDVTALGRIDRGEDVAIGGSEWTLRNVGAGPPRRTSRPGALLMPLVFTLVTVGLAALFAALAVGVVPGSVGRIRDATGTPGGVAVSIFIGSIALVALPILLLATLITVIGPLIVLAVYAVGAALGSVGAGEVIGRRIMPGAGRGAGAALGAGALATALALPLYFGVEMGLGVLYCGTVLVAWGAAAWSLGASLRGFAARRTMTPVASEPHQATGTVEVPDDVIQRAESLVRSIGADARRLDGSEDPDSPPAGLADLPGMTPIYVALLRSSGIGSAADLAASSAEAVTAALDRPGIRPAEPELIERWLGVARRGG